MTTLFVLGLVTLPLQVIQIGIAQPTHIWLIGALAIIVLRQAVAVTRLEICVFIVFAITTVLLTVLQPYDRVKEGQQLLKFLAIYPGFYVVGRAVGVFYAERRLPYDYAHLFIFLAIQYAIEVLAVPVLYKALDFGEGALHGTFLERNWFAIYFFLTSYLLFLQAKDNSKYVPFFLLNGIVTVLSGSKTSFIACGIVFLVKSKLSIYLKLSLLLVGAAFYWYVFSGEFSQDMLAVRLEEERGLALQVSTGLISDNPLGYGAGFVEAYFSHIDVIVRGLGEGTAAVFAAPLDLAIIAGIVGLASWVVLFLGVGLGAASYLAPIAAWSLLNPLHQSEIVYLFMGVLVSWAQHDRIRARTEIAPNIGAARLSHVANA